MPDGGKGTRVFEGDPAKATLSGGNTFTVEAEQGKSFVLELIRVEEKSEN